MGISGSAVAAVIGATWAALTGATFVDECAQEGFLAPTDKSWLKQGQTFQHNGQLYEWKRYTQISWYTELIAVPPSADVLKVHEHSVREIAKEAWADGYVCGDLHVYIKQLASYGTVDPTATCGTFGIKVFARPIFPEERPTYKLAEERALALYAAECAALLKPYYRMEDKWLTTRVS